MVAPGKRTGGAMALPLRSGGAFNAVGAASPLPLIGEAADCVGVTVPPKTIDGDREGCTVRPPIRIGGDSGSGAIPTMVQMRRVSLAQPQRSMISKPSR